MRDFMCNSCDAGDPCFLGSYAVWTGRHLLTFRRVVRDARVQTLRLRLTSITVDAVQLYRIFNSTVVSTSNLAFKYYL